MHLDSVELLEEIVHFRMRSFNRLTVEKQLDFSVMKTESPFGQVDTFFVESEPVIQPSLRSVF